MKLYKPYINNMQDIEDIEKVPLESRIKQRTAYDVLKASAEKWPDRKAFIFLPPHDPLGEPRIFTYQEFFHKVNQIANLLVEDCGVTAGKAISCLLPNIPENYFLLFAAQAAGIANPLNPKLPPEQIAELLQTAESEILISMGPQTNPELWENILAIRKLYPGLRKILVLEDYSDPQQDIDSFYRLLEKQPLSFENKEINPETVCSYFHTSGTVGVPKLVQHTHRGSLHAAWGTGIFADYQRENTVLLSGFPLFHVSAAIPETLSALLYGASVVVMGPQGWADPSVIAHFWKIVERYKGTSMAAVPPIYKALIQVPLNGATIDSLHSALSGNVSMNKEDSDIFYGITEVRVSTLWGQTEAIVGCINPSPVPGNKTFGSAGLRLPYLQMKILNNHLEECPSQEPGTLYIKGSSVGQYKNTELNKKTFTHKNWFNTGDRAYKDDEGYIWILGRQSDFILWENNYISLLAIETILQQNPLIKKAAVISAPDQILGERIYAFVVVDPKTDINLNALIQQLQTTINQQFNALPIQIECRNCLPLNGMGKVIKHQLMEELESVQQKKKVS